MAKYMHLLRKSAPCFKCRTREVRKESGHSFLVSGKKSNVTMELHGNSNINQTSTLSKNLYCKLIPAAFPYCANIQTVNSSQLVATGRGQNMVAGRQFWRTMTQHCEKSTDCNTSLLSLLCTDMASPCQSHTSWSLLLLTHCQHAGLLHPSTGICKLLQGSKGQTDIAKLLNKYSPTVLNAAATPPGPGTPWVLPAQPGTAQRSPCRLRLFRRQCPHAQHVRPHAPARGTGRYTRALPRSSAVWVAVWQRGEVTRRQVSSNSCNKVYQSLSNHTQRHDFQRTCCTSVTYCLI